jgi:hypothetical protein
MGKNKYILMLWMVMTLVSACQGITASPVTVTSAPTRSATSAPLTATLTVVRPTVTPSQRPTKTALLTATPPPSTVTPTPFLPAVLSQIEPENITSLEKIAEIPVKEIYQLAISPTGNYVATLSEHWEDRSRYLEVWDLNTGAQVYQQEKMDIPWGLSFLPNESLLMVLFPKDQPQVRIYDLTRGEIVRNLDIPLKEGALSPNGEIFAAGNVTENGESSMITLYDFATGQEKSTLSSVGQVMVLYFTPDGRFLVAGFQTSGHFRLKLWQVATWEQVTEMVDYSSPVFTQGSDLAANSREGKIYLFDSKGWVLRSSFDNMDEYGNGKPQSFSSDGRILIGSDSYRTVFWEVITGKEMLTLPNDGYGLFSPLGNMVLTWCYQCNLTIWGVKP